MKHIFMFLILIMCLSESNAQDKKSSKRTNLILLELALQQQEYSSVITPIPNPSPVKQCHCSPNCECGCNEGKECDCWPTKQSIRKEEPTSLPAQSVPVRSFLHYVPAHAPTPTYNWSTPRMRGFRSIGSGFSSGSCSS